MDDIKLLMANEIPRLRRFALALTATPHEADDLVQDCLERAIRKRHQWRRQGSIRSWLFRILYSVFANQSRFRRRQRRQKPLDAGDAAEALAAAPRQEHEMALQDVGEALARLPRNQRAAILLVAVEGMTYDEAAAVMDVPVGTVRSRLSRGREGLTAIWEAREASVPLRRVK